MLALGLWSARNKSIHDLTAATLAQKERGHLG
jgi:hypothetical protein